MYSLVLQSALDIADGEKKAIAEAVKTEGGVLVFNQQSFVGNGIVQIDGQSRYVEGIPAKGYAVVRPREIRGSVACEDRRLENDFFVVPFDEHYEITSLYDKVACCEVIDTSKGTGNQIEVYKDYPRDYDAWEITNYYKEKKYPLNAIERVTFLQDGARAGVEIARRFLGSTFVQKIWLYEDIKRIDFETDVDWKQEYLLMKAEFPVRINVDRATYELQFGALERPTHSNTSWDAAKFEVCGHKYCDFSEYDYGVAMLNDCKYGHDIHDGVMRLTLLKSSNYPNPAADKCQHTFTYSLVSHEGDYRAAGVVQMAYDLNAPMTAIAVGAQDGILPESYSFVSVAAANVLVDTVKKAEDSDALIVRMYEAYNKRVDATLSFAFQPKRVVLCDLMERELKETEINGNSIHISAKPFEIITIKILKLRT